MGMMVRNIPNRYAQKDFVKEFESLGFKDTFNFLYLPMDKKTHCNVGYCFVNFVNHHWAARCAEVMHCYSFRKQRKGCEKIAAVTVAHLQGLEANMLHYKNALVSGGSRRAPGPLVVPSSVQCF